MYFPSLGKNCIWNVADKKCSSFPLHWLISDSQSLQTCLEWVDDSIKRFLDNRDLRFWMDEMSLEFDNCNTPQLIRTR